MERNELLSLQSLRSIPLFNLKVTINKQWRPESDGEVSEGGRGGRGGRQEGRECSARSESDGAQRCAVQSIACPNPPLDLQNNNQLSMATKEEVKGKGQAGEGWRDGGGGRECE